MSVLSRALAVVVLLAAALDPTAAEAQSRWWAFDTRRYFDPLRAGVRAAQTSVLFPAVSDPVEFAPDRSDFLAWDISLGTEIPILGRESAPAVGPMPRGGWGVGLWLPISFHMIENLSDEESSRPIVNTDYRFSAMLKVVWQGWRTTALQGRLSLGHESTHLGDEFSILAVRRSPETFRRVNVSHEDVAYGVGVRHLLEEVPWLGQTELLVRHTGVYPINPGYYSPELSEVQIDSVTAPHRKYQWGVGAQAVPEEAWRPWISLELRNRIVYGYDRPTAHLPEETKLSMNLLVGTRTETFATGPAASFELYARLYHGVNPAGQFRNDPSYTLYGAGIMVRIGGW